MCTLSETKLKGKCKVMFGEVVGGCLAWRAGGTWPFIEWACRRCVVEWKEVSSRLMWVRVTIERVSWVFISAYGPGMRRVRRR